jgi:hypothetical protein
MSYIQKNLKQKATVFIRGTSDGYGGYSYTTVTVNCRWEEKQVLFTTYLAEEKVSKAIVYVDTDVSVGSFIYLGETTDTTPPFDAYEILKFNKSPNLKNTDFERKVII